MAKGSKRRKAAGKPASEKFVEDAPQTAFGLGPEWVWGLALFLAVVLVYQPAWRAGIVWDDESVFTVNPVIVGPLGLKEIWTTGAADICPFTLTTFWAEHKLWGATLWPYHLITIFLHGACAVVLWRVLRGLRIPGAWLGAGLWALHPLQVESVAWMTEMKNTESGVFYLLSILFFVRELKADPGSGQKRWMYALALLFAALAMASKSSTVILPLVLCLCAWWMEDRWNWRNLLKVAPILVMSVAASLLSMRTQSVQVASIVDAQWTRSWPERLATAGDDVWFYLGKLLWPYPLLTIYPRWKIDAGQVTAYLSLLAVIVVFLVLWWKRESWSRPWFFAYAYFLVALVPVLGLVDNSFFRFSFVADHFQYLAGMGPLALIGAGLVRWCKPAMQACVGAGLLLLLGAMSWQQASIYDNEETLWKHTLVWNPGCWMAYNTLGAYFVGKGELDEGIAQYQQALAIYPRYVDAHYGLGVVLAQKGRHDEAMNQYQAALDINPAYFKAHNNMGEELALKGQVDPAIGQFREALDRNPDYAEAHYNLGVALYHKGDSDGAIGHFQVALEFEPKAETANSLGAIYAQKGRTDEALAQFQRALQLDPNDAGAHKNLGALFLQTGRLDEALGQFQEALKLNPADVDAQKGMEEAKAKMDRGGTQK